MLRCYFGSGCCISRSTNCAALLALCRRALRRQQRLGHLVAVEQEGARSAPRRSKSPAPRTPARCRRCARRRPRRRPARAIASRRAQARMASSMRAARSAARPRNGSEITSRSCSRGSVAGRVPAAASAARWRCSRQACSTRAQQILAVAEVPVEAAARDLPAAAPARRRARCRCPGRPAPRWRPRSSARASATLRAASVGTRPCGGVRRWRRRQAGHRVGERRPHDDAIQWCMETGVNPDAPDATRSRIAPYTYTCVWR